MKLFFAILFILFGMGIGFGIAKWHDKNYRDQRRWDWSDYEDGG